MENDERITFPPFKHVGSYTMVEDEHYAKLKADKELLQMKYAILRLGVVNISEAFANLAYTIETDPYMGVNELMRIINMISKSVGQVLNDNEELS